MPIPPNLKEAAVAMDRADAIYNHLLAELGIKPGDDSPEMGTALTSLLGRYLSSHQPWGAVSDKAVAILQTMVRGAMQMAVIYELQALDKETADAPR